MDKIAAQPQARWIGNWNVDVRGDVDRFVTAATSANALLVLVAYNIPLRDCGSYSGGGASSPEAYRDWINAFAAGIGARRAAVILEPDALAGMGCLSAADQQTRTELLSFAVQTFKALGATSVYLDAGHSHWQSAATMASRLNSAGIANATGFSLNVSNFYYTSEQLSYGNAISALVGGKHYVIDTSRNGLGSAGDDLWCNPEGRALGERPTATTGNALADAYLWIKTPGESDGSCNGNPRSGTWMPEYALGLAQRASY
jgi:endoglucanase